MDGGRVKRRRSVGCIRNLVYVVSVVFVVYVVLILSSLIHQIEICVIPKIHKNL